jgi:hypothetical protein
MVDDSIHETYLVKKSLRLLFQAAACDLLVRDASYEYKGAIPSFV